MGEALCPPKKGLSRQKRGRRELSKATSPDKRGSHNKLTLETSNREISWAPTGRREKENKSAVKTETGSSPHRLGISVHLCTLPAHVRLQHPLSPNPGQLSRSKVWHKAFPTAKGGQECIRTCPDPARVELGMCSSAQERYLLLPRSFSASAVQQQC